MLTVRRPFFLAAPHGPLGFVAPRRWKHPQFYQNRVLDGYLVKPTKQITLRQLVVFGRHVTADRLFLSANYVRQELPVRLARRIRDFQNLPFIVGTNPYLQHVYDLYWEAFEYFRRLPKVDTLERNHQFAQALKAKLDEHLVIIPKLALGINECSDLMAPKTMDRFMNAMLRSRISRRVLAEQHIALTNHYELVNGLTDQLATADEVDDDVHLNPAPYGFNYDSEQLNTLSSQSSAAVGIVHTACSARDIAERCSARCREVFRQVYHTRITPPVAVDGALGAQFTYIPDHIEYILYEVLKNAMRAVMDATTPSSSSTMATQSLALDQPDADNGSSNPYPPITVTICEGSSTLVFRISDQGGGIPSDIVDTIWDYGPNRKSQISNFHQMPQLAGKIDDPIGHLSPLTHFGMGLPMSRVYVNYWGGKIQVHTMEGFGTDVYVHLPKLGNQREHIEVTENEAARKESVAAEAADEEPLITEISASPVDFQHPLYIQDPFTSPETVTAATATTRQSQRGHG
ncbi:[Pyruvate dehydrogenase (acetyl-transferring)] kinase 2, mitochondrial [Dimargaris verticillata]|uniref:Protein-serine/threonine kinase n=1 Tax=Dimargaris verticillata TaxID=2761393 RepID=A0A9W8B7N7_9FUNG|nr:[Pyruvate dehydrogenase (acetyl-transferring)] kinase 2, mitochondrial [Dimargaris verticillata]